MWIILFLLLLSTNLDLNIIDLLTLDYEIHNLVEFSLRDISFIWTAAITLFN